MRASRGRQREPVRGPHRDAPPAERSRRPARRPLRTSRSARHSSTCICARSAKAFIASGVETDGSSSNGRPLLVPCPRAAASPSIRRSPWPGASSATTPTPRFCTNWTASCGDVADTACAAGRRGRCTPWRGTAPSGPRAPSAGPAPSRRCDLEVEAPGREGRRRRPSPSRTFIGAGSQSRAEQLGHVLVVEALAVIVGDVGASRLRTWRGGRGHLRDGGNRSRT